MSIHLRRHPALPDTGRGRGMEMRAASEQGVPPVKRDTSSPTITTPRLTAPPRVGEGGGVTIGAEGLGKSYEWRPVLREVSFAVGAGATVALLGPNGAGKTTLLRILATLTRPSRGHAAIAGFDVVRDATAVRQSVGYVAHTPLLYEELSADENLRFFARMYGVGDAKLRVAELLDRVGLRALAHDQVRALSRGQAQRLALARAILHMPSVLLLDEPDAGLDDVGLDLLADLIAERRAAGQTTVLATHTHARGLALADEVLVLVGGRLAHSGPAQALTAEAVREVYQRAARGKGGAR